MEVFRISKTNYIDDLSGTGARLAGGRWNSKGDAVVYTSSSRALAALETLVHLPPSLLPPHLSLAVIFIPDDSWIIVDECDLPNGWSELRPIPELATITRDWIFREKSLVLRVPSAVIAGEYNFLLNPNHPTFGEVRMQSVEPFHFDPRLLHL
jgi:RES domain-containing protein